MMMMASLGTSVYSSDLKTMNMSSAEGVKAVKFYLDFAKANVGHNVVNPVSTSGDELFKASRLAMGGYGYWFGGGLTQEKVAATARLAPAPVFEGAERVSTCSAGTGYYISKHSKNHDASFTFLEWYLGGKPAQDRAKVGWGIPTLKSLHELLPKEKEFQKLAYETQMAELKYLKPMTYSPYASTASLDAIISKALVEGVKAGKDAEAIAADITAEGNKILAEGVEKAN